jgi:hypothetical protein
MKLDDFKILAKVAIGSMTFGAYHMYITTNMINENNRNNQLRIDENNRNNQFRIDENNRNTQLRFDELFKKIEKLERFNQ